MGAGLSETEEMVVGLVLKSLERCSRGCPPGDEPWFDGGLSGRAAVFV